jgi:hypothetical protein
MNANVDTVLARLSDAKRLRIGWAEAGQLVRIGLSTNTGKGRAVRSSGFLALASERSGYSINALLRFAALRQFAEEAAAAGRAPLETLTRARFAALETVKRVTALDAKAGDKLIQRLAAGRLRLADARAEHDQVAAAAGRRLLPGKGIGARRSAAQERQALELVRGNLHEFTGTKAARFSDQPLPRAFRFVHADAIAYRLDYKTSDFIDAFELKALAAWTPRSVLDDMMARVTLASRFYRRTWAVVIDPCVSHTSYLLEMLELLRLKAVGVAALHLTTERFEFLQRPQGVPSPDQRSEMRAALLSRL